MPKLKLLNIKKEQKKATKLKKLREETKRNFPPQKIDRHEKMIDKRKSMGELKNLLWKTRQVKTKTPETSVIVKMAPTRQAPKLTAGQKRNLKKIPLPTPPLPPVPPPRIKKGKPLPSLPKQKEYPDQRVENSKSYDNILRAMQNKGIDLNKNGKVNEYLESIKNKNTQVSSYLAMSYYHRKKDNNTGEKFFRELAVLLRNKQQEGKDQLVSKNREFISYAESCQYRDALKDLEHFKNHMEYLALCLYTLIPPLRSEWCNMEIVEQKHEGKRQEEPEGNYLKITDKKMVYVIQDDKVVKSHGILRAVVNSQLEKILRRSFRLFPRNYVLSTKNKTNPMPYQSFRAMLLGIDERISIDTLRSAYATAWLSSFRSEADKKRIAMLMRTSVNMINTEYVKKKHVEKGEAKEEKKMIRTKSAGEALSPLEEQKKEKDPEKKVSTRPQQLLKAQAKYINNPLNKKIKTIKNQISAMKRKGIDPTESLITKYKFYKQGQVWKSTVLDGLLKQRASK